MSRSMSVAVTVVTAVLFSATLIAAAAPPPSDVIVGAVLLSATSVTVTEIAWVSVSVPSLTCTSTS